jgi:hypothetical protein
MARTRRFELTHKRHTRFLCVELKRQAEALDPARKTPDYVTRSLPAELTGLSLGCNRANIVGGVSERKAIRFTAAFFDAMLTP